MRKICMFLLLNFVVLLSFEQLHAQATASEMQQLINDQFSFAAQQYKILEKNVPNDKMPKTYYANTGKVESSETKWWCSGFFPAS